MPLLPRLALPFPTFFSLFFLLPRLRAPLCALLLSLFAFSPAWAEMLQGRVVGVADGDTITVLDADKTQHKIRLAGIDAPEKKQPYGQRSKQHLSDLVYGQTVAVDWQKRDRYGRIIGKVWRGQTDVCLSQLHAGMAWHYKQYNKDLPRADRLSYAVAEQAARNDGTGLWQENGPVAPWDFRRKKAD